MELAILTGGGAAQPARRAMEIKGTSAFMQVSLCGEVMI
jgi:hypothetical protein